MTENVKRLSFYSEYEPTEAWLALDQIRALVLRSTRPELVTWTDAAIPNLRDAEEATLQPLLHPEPKGEPKATEATAARVDKASSTLYRRLDQEAGYVGLSPDAKGAAELRTLGWPTGLRKVASTSYADKVAHGERLVTILEAEPHVALLTRLHVAPVAEELAAAVAAFRAALRPVEPAPRTAPTSEAIERATSWYIWAICGIFSAYSQGQEREVADRTLVLQPHLALNATVHARLSAKAQAAREEAARKKEEEARRAEQERCAKEAGANATPATQATGTR